jgi:hypothetical protein
VEGPRGPKAKPGVLGGGLAGNSYGERGGGDPEYTKESLPILYINPSFHPITFSYCFITYIKNLIRSNNPTFFINQFITNL